MSCNLFRFLGDLIRDADFDLVIPGSPHGVLDIAVDRPFYDSAGKEQKKTEFFRIKSYGPAAEKVGCLGKGSRVLVQGYIETTRFEQNGKMEYGIDFVAETIDYLKVAKPACWGRDVNRLSVGSETMEGQNA